MGSPHEQYSTELGEITEDQETLDEDDEGSFQPWFDLRILYGVPVGHYTLCRASKTRMLGSIVSRLAASTVGCGKWNGGYACLGGTDRQPAERTDEHRSHIISCSLRCKVGWEKDQTVCLSFYNVAHLSIDRV